MHTTKRNKLSELQGIISKMPLEMFGAIALPEFGVPWRDLSAAVRNARLPMLPASLARVLCKHVSAELCEEEIEDIVARLRLKLVATKPRTWHTIRLSEELGPVSMTDIPGRIIQALKKNKRFMRPDVQTVLLGDLMFLSIQLISEQKEGSVLYVATPPGQPVALVSTVTAAGLLKATVEGLGYKKYENANLSGRDIQSLLRISDRAWNANAEHLTEIPDYAPIPVITECGIDYTHKKYDEEYIDNILGPNPPIITDLTINSTRPFIDRSRLDKNIKLSLSIHTEDLAKTLKSWANKGAIGPTSEFFQIFHKIKSNNINYCKEDSD
nr:uncharacterized protein LOC110381318 [Helicoverpa armigera]